MIKADKIFLLTDEITGLEVVEYKESGDEYKPVKEQSNVIVLTEVELEEEKMKEAISFAEWKEEKFTKLWGLYFHRNPGIKVANFASNFNKEDGMTTEQLYSIFKTKQSE